MTQNAIAFGMTNPVKVVGVSVARFFDGQPQFGVPEGLIAAPDQLPTLLDLGMQKRRSHSFRNSPERSFGTALNPRMRRLA